MESTLLDTSLLEIYTTIADSTTPPKKQLMQIRIHTQTGVPPSKSIVSFEAPLEDEESSTQIVPDVVPKTICTNGITREHWQQNCREQNCAVDDKDKDMRWKYRRIIGILVDSVE